MKTKVFTIAAVVALLAAFVYVSSLPVTAQSTQKVTIPVLLQEFVLTVAEQNYNPSTWTYTLADLPKSGYQVDVYRCKDAFAGDGVYRGCTMMRSPWENWATAEFQIQGCCVFVPRMPQNNVPTSAYGDIFVFRYQVDRQFPVTN